MDPKNKNRIKPIIKFNGGRGAILCNMCKVIIKENLTWTEFRGKTDLLFCAKCALEMVMKIFKSEHYESKSALSETEVSGSNQNFGL